MSGGVASARSLAGLRSGDPTAIDRAAWAILALAGAAAAVLILWLNRGTIFFFDELIWFADLAGDNDLSSVLTPHNSHLHGTTRTLYLLIAETVGPEYLVFRVLGVVSVLLCSALFFALAKRRVSTPVALAPAILLLFYGSAWQHVVGPIGFTVVFSIAAGLAALLALERGDRRGDALACAFVSLSVFTFTVGLGYLVGVAISVLLRSDRLKRLWIFAVPLLLYTAWWLWAQQFDQGRTTLSNIGEIGGFFTESAAVVTGGLSGVNIPFSRFGDAAAVTEAPASMLGWIVAAALVAALAWRIWRGNINPSLYASLGVLGTYWLAAALSNPIFFDAQSDAVRYVFPGSVGILLVATDALRGVRIGRGVAIAALAVMAFSLAMNLVFLRDGASYLRDVYSTSTAGKLTALELAGGLEPGSAGGGSGRAPDAPADPGASLIAYGPDPADYIEAASRFGSPAYSLDELRAAAPRAQVSADEALLTAYGLELEPTSGPRDRVSCTVSSSTAPLPVGGAYLLARGSDPAPLSVSRFSSAPGRPLGELPADRWSALEIPADAAPDEWMLTSPAGSPVEICPIG